MPVFLFLYDPGNRFFVCPFFSEYGGKIAVEEKAADTVEIGSQRATGSRVCRVPRSNGAQQRQHSS